MSQSTDTTTASDAGTETTPALRVLRGNPSPEELAALTVVLAAASASGGEAEDGPQRGIWANRARNLGVAPIGARRRSSWGWRTAR